MPSFILNSANTGIQSHNLEKLFFFRQDFLAMSLSKTLGDFKVPAFSHSGGWARSRLHKGLRSNSK